MNEHLDIKRILEWQRQFARDRDWEKFHTPKNLVMALSAEVGELTELFQWLSEDHTQAMMQEPKKSQAVKYEIADVFYYLTRLADILGVDLEEAFMEKMKLNEKKYPAHLVKGSSKKYTEWSEQQNRVSHSHESVS